MHNIQVAWPPGSPAWLPGQHNQAQGSQSEPPPVQPSPSSPSGPLPGATSIAGSNGNGVAHQVSHFAQAFLEGVNNVHDAIPVLPTMTMPAMPAALTHSQHVHWPASPVSPAFPLAGYASWPASPAPMMSPAPVAPPIKASAAELHAALVARQGAQRGGRAGPARAAPSPRQPVPLSYLPIVREGLKGMPPSTPRSERALASTQNSELGCFSSCFGRRRVKEKEKPKENVKEQENHSPRSPRHKKKKAQLERFAEAQHTNVSHFKKQIVPGTWLAVDTDTPLYENLESARVVGKLYAGDMVEVARAYKAVTKGPRDEFIAIKPHGAVDARNVAIIKKEEVFLPMTIKGIQVVTQIGEDHWRVNDLTNHLHIHGVHYRTSKNHDDKCDIGVDALQVVKGINEGDGWVRCEVPRHHVKRYMPKEVFGIPIMVCEAASGWRLDNEHLKAATRGVAFRKSEHMDDIDPSRFGKRWGDVISGIDTGKGWILCT